MAEGKLPFTMEEIFDYMKIDYLKYARGQNSFNIPCPSCDRTGTKRKLNVNLAKGKWRCPKCGAGGNAVNFFHFAETGNFELSKTDYVKEIERLTVAMKGDMAYVQRRAKNDARWKSEEKVKTAEIADDDTLHKTFSTLLQWEGFALLEEHKQNLLKRGLDEQSILHNGYGSFPAGIQLERFVRQDIKAAYANNNWEKVRGDHPTLRRTSSLSLMAGLTVAAWLKQQGCQLRGVPGFFRFCGHWCFLIPQKGIAIPTRNLDGQIVAMQVRADAGKVRYMTVSAKGLELAVVEGISRAHWPLSNDPLQAPSDDGDPGTEIIVTEGPLKADVALCLLQKKENAPNVAFVAIQGITNTNSLLRVLETVKGAYQYKEVTNAFDMDRLTSPNVLKGSVRLRKLLKDMGIRFVPLFWDEPTAVKAAEINRAACIKEEVALPEKLSPNPYVALAQYTQALAEAGKQPPAEWDSNTKGIDDFLFSQADH